MKKIGNYIASKDFRALLVVPHEHTLPINRYSESAINSIFYFIAELTGHKCLGKTEADKIEAGKQAYLNRELPNLALNFSYHKQKAFHEAKERTQHKDILAKATMSHEEHLKELHELIWLERIYEQLDKLYASTPITNILERRLNRLKTQYTEYLTKSSQWHQSRLEGIQNDIASTRQQLTRLIPTVYWNIPLEIDHSMSLAQIVGALTNDERVLQSTGVIGDKISDPWHIDYVRRLVAKAVGTPTFYGSSQSAVSLVKAKKISLDKEEIKRLKKEFATGRFSILKQFKDLLIQNYNIHNPIIKVSTGFKTFDIHVNKFKPAGAETVVTEAFDGKKFKFSFTKEPILVPDYTRMKLFWATCLVHHLDSELVEGNLVYHAIMKNRWLLDIHDAYLCLPNHATLIRESSASGLKTLNDNRFSIIDNFRQSIGATTPRSDIQYMKLLKAVKDAGDTEFTRLCMK